MSGMPETQAAPARILVVDDERTDRQLMELLLKSEGFSVFTATSGEEALAFIAQDPPDLVLLDVMMPDMDGYQLAEHIKSNNTEAPIPIIMVTVLDDHEAMMRSLAAGAQDYLVKPVNRAELNIRVRNLLRLKAYGDLKGRYSQLLEREVGCRTADLINSEALYRTTFEAAPVGIVRADMTGRWLHVNQRLCDLLGYSRVELQTKSVQDSIRCEEQAGRAAPPFIALPHGSERKVIEQRYRRRDGVVLWARIVVSVRHDVRGQAQELILVIEDITERRALEEQVEQTVARLTASEQRYRGLLENANDAIAVLTPGGVVREMNQRWAEIVGLPREQLIGRHVAEFTTSGDAESLATHFCEGLVSNDRSETVKIATTGGSHLLLELSFSSIEVGGERLVLTIGRDVTEQRQLEAQLRQAQKLEVIGRLAGGVAHDFNNILTAILGFCELLLLDLPPDNASRADISEIKSAGERAARLTGQLLAFSRNQPQRASILNVNGVLQGMEPMLRRLTAAHVDLVLSLQDDVGTIKVETTQLEQIVVNLLVNATDAMPRGGRLTIETANVHLGTSYRSHHLPVTPGDYVMVAVSDTGAGMDEATTQRMFDPFFTTKEVGKGTGLGLATVYGIVKQNGGDIWVHSERDHGSVFKIYFPRVRAAASTAVMVLGTPDRIRPGSETILLVEDDEAVRRLAHLVLERAGYRVIAAGDPKDAFAVATRNGDAIDLLISDVILPDSDGEPLFDRLAKIHPNLRVLYMSGYADDAVSRHGVIVDGTPFLQKPFTPQGLGAKVREVIESSQAAAAPLAPARQPISN